MASPCPGRAERSSSGRSASACRAAALAAALSLAGCASAFILHPSTGPSGPPEAQRFIEVPGSGTKLEALVVRRGGGCEPSLFVVEFSGNAGQATATTLPQKLQAAAPMEIWVVNYPGFGASEGRRRLRSIPPAARAAFDAVAERAGSRPIIAYGYSVGSLPALHLAGQRPVKAALFRNIPCLARLVMLRWGWWNLWLAAIPVAAQIPRSMSCEWGARHARAPAAFLMSEHDEVCPPRHQRLAFRRYAGPKLAIPMQEATHNDPVPEAAQAELLDWLARTLGPHLPQPTDACPSQLYDRYRQGTSTPGPFSGFAEKGRGGTG